MTSKEKIKSVIDAGFIAIASDETPPLTLGFSPDFIVNTTGDAIREWRSDEPCPYPELLLKPEA